MVIIKFNTGSLDRLDGSVDGYVQVLEKVIERIKEGYVEAPVRDVNGNKIGRFCLTLEDQDRDRVDYLP